MGGCADYCDALIPVSGGRWPVNFGHFFIVGMEWVHHVDREIRGCQIQLCVVYAQASSRANSQYSGWSVRAVARQ